MTFIEDLEREACIAAPSFAHFLELQMADRHFHAVPGAKMFCQLFRKINRTVLPTGAAKRNHEVFKPSLPVTGYAGID